ncbi:MAG TPA: histidinol dehydrogenase [Bacteroidales bacterium]|nr:histidinol dehydrogenase [Bacteroidales bacterium]
MKTILFPEKEKWETLCTRPGIKRSDLESVVKDIIEGVRNNGDEALLYYTEKFEGVKPDRLKVTKKETDEGVSMVSDDLKKAINIARSNIEKFHLAQLKEEAPVEIANGIKCWRKSVPVEKVGLYIPGGSAPLFSTVLMLGIPAKIAGCREIILCTPADKAGKVNPVILYTANLIGIKEIFKAGGAQAIAAMAYGTETIPEVYKIFGPGNQYVTRAKELVQQDGIPIDMPAGPSEVLVIADNSADPDFVAADLLSQAEHGTDSQVILVSDSPDLPEKVNIAVERQLSELPRKEIASKALDNSLMIVLKNLDECMEFSNSYAPEHLIINTHNSRAMAEKVLNAGSVFIGSFSCESAGDYASGTNHTLPTNGFAKNFSGVSVESFQKNISFQEITEEGIMAIGPAIETMAEAEKLRAHRNAVTIRLKSLKNG